VTGDARGVALITGAAGAIGGEVARGLAAQGMHVLIADRHGADAVAGGLREGGLAAQAVELDVTSSEGWEGMARMVRDEHGRLDVLVNAAGIEGTTGRLWEQSPENFELVMRVNATGTFLAMRSLLPIMCEAKGGAVVNISSTAGVLGLPGMAPYVASKHAVIGLTRAAAIEVAGVGVRVNVVCPGPTTGRMMHQIERGARPDDPARAGAAYRAAIPLRRYADPVEVAATVLHLVSKGSSYITGAVVMVDGGMSAL